MSLLDVGCGPGTITADLAGIVAPGRVTAVENAPEVLETARREAGSAEPVGFVAADAHALGLASGVFDVVHAHQVLQHVADPVQVLREMRRVCTPTGVVAVRDSDYGAFTWYPEIPELDEWLALYQRLARSNGGEPDAGRRLLSWCLQAGFRDVTPSSSTWCFATPQDREWWGSLWAERVADSRFAEKALASGLAGRADLERIADGWRAWAAAPDGWMSILHSEVLARP
jgi:ubiquinone/menaquinone biosynthesis C-methylase UbiE